MSEEFVYQEIKWQCGGCGSPRTLVRVGVSSLGELVALWKCHTCNHDVMARMPLESLIKAIPSHPLRPPLKAPLISEDDKKLAKLMHIDLGGADATA